MKAHRSFGGFFIFLVSLIQQVAAGGFLSQEQP
jgi:hypothetical protein